MFYKESHAAYYDLDLDLHVKKTKETKCTALYPSIIYIAYPSEGHWGSWSQSQEEEVEVSAGNPRKQVENMQVTHTKTQNQSGSDPLGQLGDSAWSYSASHRTACCPTNDSVLLKSKGQTRLWQLMHCRRIRARDCRPKIKLKVCPSPLLVWKFKFYIHNRWKRSVENTQCITDVICHTTTGACTKQLCFKIPVG